MSTLNLENIKHPDSASNNISVDSSGRVGIGTSSPTRTLDVRGFISGSDGTTTTEIVNGGGVGYVGTKSNHPLSLQTNNVGRVNVDTAGRVTMPYQPAFFAYLNASATQPSAVNVVAGTFSTLHNIGGHYSTSTKRFTAPIGGLYSFTVNFATQSNTPSFSYFSAEVHVNGVRKTGGWTGVASPSYHKATSTFTLQLSSGDYVEMGQEVNASYALQGNGNGTQPMTFFSGYLIG